MHFYQNFLTLLAFGATLTAAQTRGGTFSKSTQQCTLTSGGPSALIAVLACPAHSQCSSDGSGCTSASYNPVADQCT
ncbi:hypothetical protein N7517_002393 [Penicillium concentricum]|uniref:Extracellular membrane protein CFEM domain-containing protein n=1 Tax=Penicillium concentricum TaxID=293559 RepID=A0A9W9STR3_9EURO|nr:uncharacterized protein N7517_002393 [Penicillium concentricum]KAJ5384482.1 hypothetical protein N7517_002393 [Penicillium concentricum]